MDTLIIAVLSFVGFIIAYHTYGRWIANKIFGLEDQAITPSRELQDGVDYVPTKREVVFGHHFTSIAGTGPIVGPAIAVFWGWLPALLWVVLGSIFIGAVHDFGALVVSLRNRGQTLGEVAGRMITPRAKMLFLLILFLSLAIAADDWTKNKKAIDVSIKKHERALIKISDEIWHNAELALEEYKSSKILADYAEKNGFSLERGVAGMPTAFIATYGSGRPRIGILGEFDANAGISQKAQSTKEALIEGAPGHGCGHNLYGTGSLGAAIAIKELIAQGKIKGTIVFYGTPAEETIFGTVWFARAGLFNDLDVCMDWHPGDDMEAATQSSKALIDFRVKFSGKASHASADPWNGFSAVDAMELFTTGINYYREHIKPTARIHYQIERAGDVVNVVPENAQIWVRVRENDRESLNVVYERVKKMAAAGALMAEVDHEVSLISGIYEILPNRRGAAAIQANFELLGPIKYTKKRNELC